MQPSDEAGAGQPSDDVRSAQPSGAPRAASTSKVGALLKRWRAMRGASQLDLAIATGMSPRQISFIETGRSRPRRETLLRIGRVLDLPYRDQNSLFEAAGFTPPFGDASLTAGDAEDAFRIVRFLLVKQEPYSALALNPRWDILATNDVCAASMAGIVAAHHLAPGSGNLLELLLAPDGLFPHLLNPEEVAVALTGRVHREAAAARADPETLDLLDGLLTAAGLGGIGTVPSPGSFVVPYRLRVGDRVVELFSTSLMLGAPADVTLQEIRIESFFPTTGLSEPGE